MSDDMLHTTTELQSFVYHFAKQEGVEMKDIRILVSAGYSFDRQKSGYGVQIMKQVGESVETIGVLPISTQLYRVLMGVDESFSVKDPQLLKSLSVSAQRISIGD